jgi:hypothetical protein
MWVMSDSPGYEPPGIIIRYVRFTPVRTIVPDRLSEFPNYPIHVMPPINFLVGASPRLGK